MFFHTSVSLLAICSTFLVPLISAQTGGFLEPVLPSNPVQCTNITLSWSATTPINETDPSYAVRIINADTMGMELAAELPLTWLGHHIDGNSMSWQVGIAAGTNISLLVTDHNGNRGYSAPTIVQAGSNSCMPRAYEPNFFQNDSRGSATSSFSASSSCIVLAAVLAALVFGFRPAL